MAIDLNEVRKLAIISMFSDDVLFDRIVLKGGNAISLVYGLGSRSSIDVDFSVHGDLEEITDVEARIFKALDDRFGSAGYVVFDKTFVKRPPSENPEFTRFGGYRIEFKLMDDATFRRINSDMEAARRGAEVVGPLQQRKFRIELSKHEYCDPKRERALENFTIYVYTPEMLAIEKIRAVCQQMPEYPNRGNKTARARDFYDIYILISKAGVVLANNITLIKNIFAAKEVPLKLMGKVNETREFHRPDWPAVRDSVAGEVEAFDFYFDFLVNELNKLEAFGNE